MTIGDFLLLVLLLVQFVVIWSVWNLTDLVKKLTDFSKQDDTVLRATDQMKDKTNQLKG